MLRVAVVSAVFLSLVACSAETEGRAPGQVEGLGTATPDCVAACTALFADCSQIDVFVDGSGAGLGAAECSRTCADEAEYDARLVALGCVAQWRAYEACVLGGLDTATCDVDTCSIEWGVYSGCTGG